MTASGATIGRLAVRNTVWVTLLGYAVQFVAFAATIVLTRTLGPQVFGLFSLGMFWSSLLGLRSKFGLASAAIRQPATDGELLGTFFVLDLLLAGASLLVVVLAAFVMVQSGYMADVVPIIVVATVAEVIPVLVGPLGLALERELQLSRLSLVSIVSTIAAYGAAILLALAGAGIWSLLAMSLITASVALVGVYVVCRWRLPQVLRLRWRFSPDMAKRLLRQGLPAGLSNLGIVTIVSQFDNFLIGTFVGTVTLGFYDRAFRTSQWPNVFLTAALMRVGFITFARLQDDLPRLTHAVRLCLWVLTTLGTPIALALIFGAEDLVQVLYGPAWLPSAFFLRFLVTYSLISPFISVAGSLAYALGNVRMTVLITVAQVMTIVGCATPLTLWLGSTGTVVGVGLTVAVGFALSCRYLFRKLPLSIAQVFGPPLLAAGMASALVLLVCQVPGWQALAPAPRLVASTAASAGSYMLFLLAMRPGETVERVRYLVSRFAGTEPQPA